MSLRRKILRTLAYKEWKERMKGVSEKYKTSFSNFWKFVNREGGDKNVHTNNDRN